MKADGLDIISFLSGSTISTFESKRCFTFFKENEFLWSVKHAFEMDSCCLYVLTLLIQLYHKPNPAEVVWDGQKQENASDLEKISVNLSVSPVS